MDWLLWVDIETTGLNANKDYILEIACVLTNFEDDNAHYTQEFTICHDKHILDDMSEWCRQQHTQSGLCERVQKSTIQLQEAEKQIVLNINQTLRVRDTLYIAGNSVHFDKKFIDQHMPLLAARLSHRIIDVSTIAVLCRNLAPGLYDNRPAKKHLHTAIQDILESIEEYKYYRTVLLGATKMTA